MNLSLLANAKANALASVPNGAYSQQAERYVTTEARQVLEAARVAESWRSEDGKNYALAALLRWRAQRGPADRGPGKLCQPIGA